MRCLKDVKGRIIQLVSVDFSVRYIGTRVWGLTQQITSIAKPFQEIAVVVILFYTPSVNTTKAIFEDYAGELTKEEYISNLKSESAASRSFP